MKASIKTHGLQYAVTAWNGLLVDGKNRARACEELGMDCPTEEFHGTEAEAIQVAWSANIERRHLLPRERAILGAKYAALLSSVHTHGTGEVSEKAAKVVGASHRSVERAIRVEKNAAPEVKTALQESVISLAQAEQLAAKPPEEQKAEVAEVIEEAKRGRGRPRKEPQEALDDEITRILEQVQEAFAKRGEMVGDAQPEHRQCVTTFGYLLEHWAVASGQRDKDALPEELDTPEFREAWQAWTTHLREKRHKQTPTARKMQLKKCLGWGVERAVAALRHSTTNGWTGLYESKGTQEASVDGLRKFLERAT